MIQLLTQYLAKSQRIPPEQISQENVFYDVHRELTSWMTVVAPAETASTLEPIESAAQLRKRLTQLLKHAWSDRWLKAPPKKKQSPHRDLIPIPGTHTSVLRLIHNILSSNSQKNSRK